MPKCPYCKSELKIKLSAQYVDEIDPSFYSLAERQLQMMPALLRGLLQQVSQAVAHQSIPVYILSCANCDTFLDVEFKIRDN
ncbi:MAG: hypothetical protein D6732_03870 [Methanobacteriota archaeon]|nr:MAG: hypothetical protein D6732_03870 [Euryarchaeota archaeon]